MARFPRLFSVQSRLGLIFLAVLCLLAISVVVTIGGLETKRQDARIIDLANQQRGVVQQVSSLAQGYVRDPSSANKSALLHATGILDRTLAALSTGGSLTTDTGERYELQPAANPALRFELDALVTGWRGIKTQIDLLLAGSSAGTAQTIIKEIEDQAPLVMAQVERVVRAFEAVSAEKSFELRAYSMIFLLGGLALLSAGWWMMSSSIIQPLARLDRSVQRIGAGDLSSPILVEGPAEVRVLASSLEAMRSQILSSHQDLQQWAETFEIRVQQRTRELEALASVSQEIYSQHSIEAVLTSVTEKARGLLNSDVAALCLLDPQGKLLRLQSAAGPESAIHKNQTLTDGPWIQQVLDPDCANPGGVRCCQGFCQIIDPQYQASHIAAPMSSREKVIGALCAGSTKPGSFRPEMAAVLHQLSGAAVVALENSRLYLQAEHAATLEERQRIASEMHDGLLQTLSFLRLMVRLMEEQLAESDLEKVMVSLYHIGRAEEQAEFEIRQAIASLQDEFPASDSLQECLNVLAKGLSITAPPVVFDTQVIVPLVLSRQESEQALRVTREAVLNAQRYSQAGVISIGLEKASDELVISIRDQGIGFNPKIEPADGRAHFGLKIMRARAARLGGSLVIQSAPGAGTLVELRWSPAGSRPA